MTKRCAWLCICIYQVCLKLNLDKNELIKLEKTLILQPYIKGYLAKPKQQCLPPPES